MMKSGGKGILGFLVLFLFPLQIQAEVCGSQADQYVCDELLIRFAPKLSEEKREEVLSENALFEKASLVKGKILHMEDFSGRSMEETLKELNSTPGVLVAEPNHILYADSQTNDTYQSIQWGLTSMNLFDAWEFSTGSSSTVVAVIDTGVDYTHPDLADNMWVNEGEIAGNGMDDDGNGYIDDVYGYDFRNDDGNPMDDHGHGTHVAGTIAAVGNNELGVVGVAYRSKIMALKFLSSSGSGTYADAAEAINYACTMGAKISNNSWGGTYYSSSLQTAVEDSNSCGMLFVAAAGNSSLDTDSSPHYPSAFSNDNVVSVASITSEDELSWFSNYGAQSVDLGAPGSSIVSTYPGSSYAYMSGTSMATPHVAGLAALLWSANSGKSHLDIKNCILNGGSALSGLANITVTGKTADALGSLNQCDSSLNNHTPVAQAGSDKYVALGAPVKVSGSGTDEDGDTLSFTWSLADPNGEVIYSSSRSSESSFTFEASQEGRYVASLIVHDSYSSSTMDYVIFTSEESTLQPSAEGRYTDENGNEFQYVNGRPLVPVGKRVILDGRDSVSYSGEIELDYQWILVSKPSGSSVAISDSDQEVAYFQPDTPGDYYVKLQITDDVNTAEEQVNFLVTDVGGGSSSGGCQLSTGQGQTSRGMAYFFVVVLGVLLALRRKVKRIEFSKRVA